MPTSSVWHWLLLTTAPAGTSAWARARALPLLQTDWPIEVGAFYWTVPAPDIVNPGREEQDSFSV